MSNKRRSNTKSKFDNFDKFLVNNPHPIQIPTEYNSKKFTIHDMKSIQPMTRTQERLFQLWNNNNLSIDGSAGTGKTFCATYLALKDILGEIENRKCDKIIFIRSAVASRDIGFLPGTEEEKMEVYETPYIQIFDFLFKKKNQYKFMKEAGIVEFHSSGFLRGQTFDNAIIIVDEAQSMNYHEISTIMTRVGTNSKMVIIGDTKQNDLIYKKNDISGFGKYLKVASMIPSMRQVTFTIADVVRSGFVKEFLVADEMYDDKEALNNTR